MNVVAHGPFRVSSLLWQPRPGAWSLTVVCRACFELQPGESPMVALPKEAPDDERHLLEEAVTLAPRKGWPEVVLVGHAYAPEGRAVPSLSVRLSVGALDKAIHVTGDRHLTLQGNVVGPFPFARMPLCWERAAGGPDTWNPAGVVMGVGARPDGWGRVVLPNLEPAGAAVTTRREFVPPVGFGLVPPMWPTRLQRLHRHAAAWSPVAWPERPLPEDFDFGYFDVAPPDQALPELSGAERIVLENLHPRHPRLVTQLCVVAPRATAGIDGVPQTLPLVCDTLAIDTDAGLAQLVWRGQLALDRPRRDGIVIVEADVPPPSQPATATVVLPAPPSFRVPPAATVPVSSPREPAKASVPLAAPVVTGPRAPTFGAPPPAPTAGVSTTETVFPSRDPAKAALPFSAGAAAPPPSSPSLPRPAPDAGPPPGISMTETVAPGRALPGAPLPFLDAARAPPGPPAVRSPPPAEPQLAAPPEVAPPVPAPAPEVAPADPPRVEAPPPPVAAPAPPAATPVAEPEPTGLRATVLARLAAGRPLYDLELSGVALDGIDFTGAVLERRSFAASSLTGCNFTAAQLSGADLTGADLTDAVFSGACLAGADLTRATVERSRFDGAILSRANLASVRGAGARFAGATMAGVDLRQARLPGAVFDRATLTNAVAAKADLTRARFVGANLEGASLRTAKLREATLAGARIDGANLSEADLSRANVHGLTLARAKTTGAILRDLVDEAPPDDAT